MIKHSNDSSSCSLGLSPSLLNEESPNSPCSPLTKFEKSASKMAVATAERRKDPVKPGAY